MNIKWFIFWTDAKMSYLGDLLEREIKVMVKSDNGGIYKWCEMTYLWNGTYSIMMLTFGMSWCQYFFTLSIYIVVLKLLTLESPAYHIWYMIHLIKILIILVIILDNISPTHHHWNLYFRLLMPLTNIFVYNYPPQRQEKVKSRRVKVLKIPKVKVFE